MRQVFCHSRAFSPSWASSRSIFAATAVFERAHPAAQCRNVFRRSRLGAPWASSGSLTALAASPVGLFVAGPAAVCARCELLVPWCAGRCSALRWDFRCFSRSLRALDRSQDVNDPADALKNQKLREQSLQRSQCLPTLANHSQRLPTSANTRPLSPAFSATLSSPSIV